VHEKPFFTYNGSLILTFTFTSLPSLFVYFTDASISAESPISYPPSRTQSAIHYHQPLIAGIAILGLYLLSSSRISLHRRLRSLQTIFYAYQFLTTSNLRKHFLVTTLRPLQRVSIDSSCTSQVEEAKAARGLPCVITANSTHPLTRKSRQSRHIKDHNVELQTQTDLEVWRCPMHLCSCWRWLSQYS